MGKAPTTEELEKKHEFTKRKRQEAVKTALWCSRLPPINTDDPEQVQERINCYFNYCAENGYVIGVEGLCNSLGITTGTFRTWLNGTARKGQEHQKICVNAEQVIRQYMEDGILAGEIPPVPSIFIMSNNHGYVQQQKVVTENIQSFIDTATPEQLEKRYSNQGTIIDATFEEKPQKQLTANAESIKQIKKTITRMKAESE